MFITAVPITKLLVVEPTHAHAQSLPEKNKIKIFPFVFLLQMINLLRREPQTNIWPDIGSRWP